MKKSILFKNGFSLMEMMVVLLIVAIVAAASAPMISKRVVRSAKGSSPWVWSGMNGSIAYNMDANDNMTAVIGATNDESGKNPRLYIKSGGLIPQLTFGDSGVYNSSLSFLADLNSGSIYLTNKELSDMTGKGSLSIGYDSQVRKSDESDVEVLATAIGHGANAHGLSSTVIGADARASVDYSTVIGVGAETSMITNGSFDDANPGVFNINSNGLIAKAMPLDFNKKYRFLWGQPVFAEQEVPLSLTDSKASIAIGYKSKADNAFAIANGALSEAAPRAIALGGGANATGIESVAIGFKSSSSQGTNYSTALGAHSEVNGVANTAIGYNATVNDSAAGTALGAASSVVGASGVALGAKSYANTKAISIGALAGQKREIGSPANLGPSGNYAPSANYASSAEDSIAIGFKSLAYGQNSVAIGHLTSAAERSIALGTNSGVFTEKSIAVGTNAAVHSDNSILVGHFAHMYGEMDNSIVIGNSSGVDMSPASNVLSIGHGANASADHAIVIGHGITNNIANSTMIGTNKVYIKNEEGEIYANDVRLKSGDDYISVKDWISGSSSDRRLKNVGEIFKAGLDEVKKLEVYNYTFKKDEKKKPHVGVMAQDLQKIFPNAVLKGDDGFLRIRFEDMFYAVVNAIKELDLKITEGFDRIAILEKKNSDLEKQNKELNKKLNDLELQIKNIEKKL